jgi:hypothetical protein
MPAVPSPPIGKLTIEHVAPQRSSGHGGASANHVAKLGNLQVVDETTNGKLANKSLTEKKKVLSEAKSWDEPALLTTATWGDAEIDDRTQCLAPNPVVAQGRLSVPAPQRRRQAVERSQLGYGARLRPPGTTRCPSRCGATMRGISSVQTGLGCQGGGKVSTCCSEGIVPWPLRNVG